MDIRPRKITTSFYGFFGHKKEISAKVVFTIDLTQKIWKRGYINFRKSGFVFELEIKYGKSSVLLEFGTAIVKLSSLFFQGGPNFANYGEESFFYLSWILPAKPVRERDAYVWSVGPSTILFLICYTDNKDDRYQGAITKTLYTTTGYNGYLS